MTPFQRTNLFATSVLLMLTASPASARQQAPIKQAPNVVVMPPMPTLITPPVFVRANPFDVNSPANPYGPLGNPFSPCSATNPYTTNAPKLVAQNGTYLGKLSANRFDPESTSNPFGKYGSPYSPTSINNPFSAYGSPYSALSPTNPFATKPPVVVSTCK